MKYENQNLSRAAYAPDEYPYGTPRETVLISQSRSIYILMTFFMTCCLVAAKPWFVRLLAIKGLSTSMRQTKIKTKVLL